MEFSAAAAAAAATAATEVKGKTHIEHQNYIHASVNGITNEYHQHAQSYPMENHRQQQNLHTRRTSSDSFGSFSLNGGGSDSLNSSGGNVGGGGGLDSMNSSWNGDATPHFEHPHQYIHPHNVKNIHIGYGRVKDDGNGEILQQESYKDEFGQNQDPQFSSNYSQPSHQDNVSQQQQYHSQPLQHEIERHYPHLDVQHRSRQPQYSQDHHEDPQQPFNPQDFPPPTPSSNLPSQNSPMNGNYDHESFPSTRYQQQQSQQQKMLPQHILQQEVQQSIPKQPKTQASNDEIIELLDDDDEEDHDFNNNVVASITSSSVAGVKRPHPSSSHIHDNNRKPTLIQPGSSIPGFEHQYRLQTQSQAAHLRYQQQQQIHPHQYPRHAKNPPSSGQAAAVEALYRAKYGQTHEPQHQNQHHQLHHRRYPPSRPRVNRVQDPKYLEFASDHIPTWTRMLPELPTHNSTDELKWFELSLLNVKEFTITGQPIGTFDGRRSSVLGFRKVIKEFSRGHGKPRFERDKEFRDESGSDGGKWRIPLGAYPAIYNYFRRLPNCTVHGIPEEQLRVASLGKARLEKGYPSVQKIMAMGVPKGLAVALAPFQRGGVDFVKEKHGRALIADDMGLGARYHWEAEFQQWLGKDSVTKIDGNLKEQDQVDNIEERNEGRLSPEHCKQPMQVLRDCEIHVLTSGKEDVLPHKHTRVVICSYGLAPTLVEAGKIRPGLFKCAIVDESHMLKNMKTKRTSFLVPVLHATSRCVLLSGTPALARPSELWPQLKILSTERDGMWENEADFFEKYVQKTSAVRRAELHTMLTGTLMIRRMKQDILKSLPNKQRAKALVDVATVPMRQEFHKCMGLLREGKGVMAKLAQKRSALRAPDNAARIDEHALAALKQERDLRLQQKMSTALMELHTSQFNHAEKENIAAEFHAQFVEEVDVWYKERLHELENCSRNLEEEEIDRKTVLNRMYSLTAKAKVPLIAENIKKWLNDPTKGKLCVFAHHLFVLDELEKLAGLSNARNSDTRFIRIDGSTNPKDRQAQIKAFQSDPGIRIAVLGITAAGVAVTLTASSTVWFAELFWTPALMIQAEDRCHRIGQNAVVNCLYFVAEGTLDILLWDLLEKKFRDLGEFVEGKEKMKIVVHKVYESIKDLKSMFSTFDKDDFDTLTQENEDDDGLEDEEGLIKLEDDLQQDITQLAQEEMIMISQGEEGDDDEDGDYTSNGGVASQNYQSKAGPGQTEEDAICIIDDDDDVPQKTKSRENEVAVVDEAVSGTPDTRRAEASSRQPASPSFDFSKPFYQSRLFSQTFEGDAFGISLNSYEGRMVVSHNTNGLSKPAPGDILVSVNGVPISYGVPLPNLLQFMRRALIEGPVELHFVEDEGFAKFFMECIAAEQQAQATAMNARRAAPVAEDENVVIELLDDD
ncbi:SNF2/helicase domain containing protein [Nitzschia inconspicua]|uniref:SNF2/helicase domain containing protein n=1 Tax=Nitzschia inconspicua TaxID=303405 RepID=A0A9K3PR27_9STRA|nr:SNF2/helicase domain containing protein [Nitzschia inconspicua]